MGNIVSEGRNGPSSRNLRVAAWTLLAAFQLTWCAAPTLLSLSPPNGSRMVVGRQPFRAQFSTSIQLGTGNIVIRKASDNSVVETIAVPSPTVSAGGPALLHGFESGTEEFSGGWGSAKRTRDSTRAHTGKASLSVTLDSDWSQAQTIYAPASQDWSEMDSVVFWAYSTAASAQVEPVTNSGTDFAWAVGRSAVGLTQNAWTRVSMPVSGIPNPKMVVSFGFNVSTAGTYWFDDIALVKAQASQLVFIPAGVFQKDNSYYVNIDASAIKEASSGQTFAGIQDATSWLVRADESPTAIQLSKAAVDENLPTGTSVGDFTTTDPDGGSIYAYTLVSGTGSTDNSLFSIGAATLKTASILDFETKSSLSIRVRTTDAQGAWFETPFTISVGNLPERTTWDVSTGAGIQAGNGNWGSDNFWTKNGTTLASWPGSGNSAEFSGSNGTWTVNVNGTMQADSLVFTASGYTLGGGTVNLNASTSTILANADATIASNLSGGIYKAGTAKVTLSANNSGMWSYTHKAGTTVAKTTGALGNGTATLDGSGRILLGNGTVFTIPLTFNSCNPDVGNGALSPDSGANAEWSGSLAVNANCVNGGNLAGAQDNSGTLTLSGALNMGGSATAIRQRAGTILYKGGGGATVLELVNGTARLGAANGLPPSASWSQPHASYSPVLDLNGFNQVFTAIHSQTGNPSIRNTAQTQSVLGLTGNVDTTFAGTISGNIAINKSGSGRQTFSGANSFQGPLAISSGTLRMANPKALGDVAGGTVVNGNGALDLGGQVVGDPEPLSISGTGPAGAGALVNGSPTAAVFAGPVVLAGNSTISAISGPISLTSQTAVSGNNNSLVLDGSGSESRLDAAIATIGGSLTKTGSGQWTLRGQSTYTGPTNVASGTLCVRGSLASQSAVSVASGATLRGTGTVGGAITVQGGAVAAGLSDSVGQLAAQSLDLSRDSASTLRARIRGTTKPGIQYDRVSLSGALVLGGKSVLELDVAELSETGTASGIATAGSVTGQFSGVKIQNNTRNLVVAVAYASSQVNVVVSGNAPSFSKGASVTVLEDAGKTTLSGWATGMSPGSGSSTQTMGFRATASRPSLFATQPSIAADGTLSFSPQADSNGTSVVRIRLGASDNPDSSVLDSFSITVKPVNDPPRFAKGPDLSAASDSVERIHSPWARSIVAGPSDESSQKTTFRISHTSPALYAVQPSLATDGTLRFTPARGANGIDTLFVRLGDDGGKADSGNDSSAIDTFRIALRPLALEIRPSTLKLLPGDTGRFHAVLSKSDGTDSVLASDAVAWSWSTDLGDLASGQVRGLLLGTSRVVGRFQGSTDSSLLVVAELDTILASKTDSVRLRAGHGIQVSVAPHGIPLAVSVAAVDSTLSSRGIEGADSAMLVSVGDGDTLRIGAPLSLIPDAKRRVGDAPSVFWLDSAGGLRQAPSTQTAGTVWFSAYGNRAWWIGYDTLPPTVEAIHSTDSMGSVPVLIRWKIRDNLADPQRRLCLQKAGQSATCRNLVVAAADTGVALVTRQDLPLGGRYWVEGSDARTTIRSDTVDIVVLLDTLVSPWRRTEDRYELLSLPYVRGSQSAHEAFRLQWGDDDPHRWRAYAADSGKLQELLQGDPLDAWGKSFWVRTRERALLPWVASRWTVSMSQIQRIRLEPGWNAIGNPLGFDLSWRQIWRMAGGDSASLAGPYLFDGPTQGWSIPDTSLRWGAWRGAAILNRSTKPLELQITSLPEAATGSGALRAMASGSSFPWLRMGVQASQAQNLASRVWLGQDRVSRAWELPPGPRSQLEAAIEDPSRAGLALLSDVRVPSDSGNLWTLCIRGLAPRQPLALQWNRSGSDTTTELWIHDDKSSRWLPLEETSEWAVGDEDQRTFLILAGPPPGPKPPRPFAVGIRGAALAWSLPDRLGRCHVRIEAFDPRGRRLALLVDEDMDPGSYGRTHRLVSPTGQVLLVLTAGGERISSRWFVRH